jgi:hypothetical protein
VLAVGDNLLWLLALVAPVLLIVLGMASLRESRRMIAETLSRGDATSPALEDLATYVAQLRASKDTAEPGDDDNQGTTGPGRQTAGGRMTCFRDGHGRHESTKLLSLILHRFRRRRE